MVKLRETPIDQAQLSFLVIDHDVVRLDIAMHHAVGMAVIQRLQQLVNVVSNVQVGQRGVQHLEIDVVDVLEDQRGGLALRIPDHVEELDDVGPAAHVLQYFDLALDFLLHGLQYFDDASAVGDDVRTLEYLGIFAASDFAYDFVILLIAPVDG